MQLMDLIVLKILITRKKQKTKEKIQQNKYSLSKKMKEKMILIQKYSIKDIIY
jgi:hypothetical protein